MNSAWRLWLNLICVIYFYCCPWANLYQIIVGMNIDKLERWWNMTLYGHSVTLTGVIEQISKVILIFK